MKFTKEDARKELMSKIPNKGQTLNLSERSIDEQLETLMPLLANDETELSDFVTTVLPIFRTADGNVRNDVSAGIKTYKEQNPPIQTPPVNKVDDPNKDDVNADLLRRIEELEKRNADNEKNATLARRRDEVTAKLGEKGCKDAEWISTLLAEVSLEGDDFDAEDRAERYIKMYNKKSASAPRNVTPQKPAGSGEDSYLSEVLKAAGEKNKNLSGLGQ